MLVARVLGGYGGIAASFRAERALAPSEARLMFYAMLACALVFAARFPALMRDLPPGIAGDAEATTALAGAQLVAHVLFAPLALYGLAALTRLVARAAGGQGSWRDARLALFWSMLLGAPVTVAAGAGASLAAAAGLAVGPLLTLAASLLVLRFWAICLAEAEGFRQTRAVFAALLAIPLAVAALTWAARLGQ
jgi:hypothetical protein